MKVARRSALALVASVMWAVVLPLDATAAATPTPVPSRLCSFGTAPTVSPTIPADSTITNQQPFNCFAWQEFIGLNWKADTSTCAADVTAGPDTFGDPSTAPVVWETYKTPAEVFLKDAAKPAAWCLPQNGPPTAAGARARAKRKSLSQLTKFEDAGPVDLHSITQTNPSESWLTARNKKLTLYEVRMNQDEFNYVDLNQLYDAMKQGELAGGDGIQLPDGTTITYGKVGAVELKAAWIELDDPSDWPRFKTSLASVRYPGDAKSHTVTVGLVGLHIIHKTANGQQFVWATFEHVDNDPSVNDKPDPTRKYTYYNPSCDPATDHYKCAPNAVPKVACTSTSPPTPPNCDPYDAPVQVVRGHPLDQPPAQPNNDIVGLNKAVQAMIASQNPNSVFRYYELVNVLWPNNNTPITPPGKRTPLTCGSPIPPPSKEVVANTVLETYVQGGVGGEPDPQPDPCNTGSSKYPGDTCLTCHAFAPAASASDSRPVLKVGQPDSTPPFAADYSFLLSHAYPPPNDGGGTSLTLLWVVLGLGGAAATTRAIFRRDARLRSVE